MLMNANRDTVLLSYWTKKYRYKYTYKFEVKVNHYHKRVRLFNRYKHLKKIVNGMANNTLYHCS